MTLAEAQTAWDMLTAFCDVWNVAAILTRDYHG